MGRWTYRYRWLVIVFWVVVLAGVGVLAPRVGSVLTSGFGEQNTEARRAFQILEEEGILNEAVFILVLSHDSLTVQDPVYEARAQTVLSAVGRYPGVARVDSFFATGNPNLVSPDGRTTFAIAGLDIPLDDVLDEVPKIRDSIPDVELDVWVTGGSAIFSDINEYTSRDLRRAEIITFPVVVLVLLLIFRTVVSVAAPVAIGAMGLGITLAVIYLLGLVTPMSVFAMNTATLLGVGAAIDYSLLMVSRYREELTDRDVEESVAVTVATAGRAILFSGITTGLGLMGLLIFELSMLRSIGIGGIVVIAASVVVALTLVPALLSVIGRRIDALPILPRALLPERPVLENPGLVGYPTSSASNGPSNCRAAGVGTPVPAGEAGHPVGQRATGGGGVEARVGEGIRGAWGRGTCTDTGGRPVRGRSC